jgi:hypothetical protein
MLLLASAPKTRFYDLTDGGYLKPKKFLADSEQIYKVAEAVVIVKGFIDASHEEGVLEEHDTTKTPRLRCGSTILRHSVEEFSEYFLLSSMAC